MTNKTTDIQPRGSQHKQTQTPDAKPVLALEGKHVTTKGETSERSTHQNLNIYAVALPRTVLTMDAAYRYLNFGGSPRRQRHALNQAEPVGGGVTKQSPPSVFLIV